MLASSTRGVISRIAFRSFSLTPAQAATLAATTDTLEAYAKTNDFAQAYEELILRGYSKVDSVNKLIDVAAQNNDEGQLQKLVGVFESEGIQPNKKTILYMRNHADKYFAEAKKTIQAEEAAADKALDDKISRKA